MNPDSIIPLIIEYRYWILIPLSLIEAPVVAFVAGTLSALGYFNIYGLMLFFFARDMIMDAFYYAVGHYGGKTAFAQKMLKKIGVQEDHFEEIRTLWAKHPGKTMFFGKLSYGIAASFIVFAGTVGMPLRTFFGWGVFVAITQFGTLLLLGYFLGGSLSTTTNVVEIINYTIIGVTIAGIAYYVLSRHMRKKFKKETDTVK